MTSHWAVVKIKSDHSCKMRSPVPGAEQSVNDRSYYFYFPSGSVVKNLPASAGDTDLIPGLGISPGEGNGNPLQYSYLENPMDGGAWWATVHGVASSRIRLSDFTFFHFHLHCYRSSSSPWKGTRSLLDREFQSPR